MTELVGSLLTTRSRRTLRVQRELGRGGQGVAFRAENTDSGTVGVLKVPHDTSPIHQAKLEYLAGLELDRECPAIHAPIDLVPMNHGFAYYMRMAPGVDLEQHVPATVRERVQVGLVIVHVVDLLHQRGIAHNDLHSGNIHIEYRDGAWQVHVFDFDGASTDRFAANVYGVERYMAPETRVELERQLPRSAPVLAERFTLAVVLHELLLLAHPAAARVPFASLADELDAFYRQGWRFDVEHMGTPPADCFSPWALGPALRTLFRCVFTAAPQERPTAAEWKAALAAVEIGLCLRCQEQFVIDRLATHCPHCWQPFPTLGLALASGCCLPFDQPLATLGRTQLGGSLRVSAEHIEVRRNGPEFVLSSKGRNGTFILDEATGRWQPLDPRVGYSLVPGQRLRVADVEATIVVVS